MKNNINCLFCDIFNKKVPSQIVFQNKSVLGFKDLYPMAKEHYLFIHKNHTENINQMVDSSVDDLSDLFHGIREFAKNCKPLDNGYRIVTNIGHNGGQTIFHTHFHVLGGEKLGSFGR